MHQNEPKMEELIKIQHELYTAPSTDENVKKLKAIQMQIERIKNEVLNKAS